MNDSKQKSGRQDNVERIENDDTFWEQWRRRITTLVTRLATVDIGPEDVHGMRRQRRRKNLIIAALTTMVLSFLYRKRQSLKSLRVISALLAIGNTTPSRLESSSPPGSDYRQASEAPLSQLWTAAKTGRVERALLMASRSAVAYSVDGKWLKSTLPPNNPSLQSDLLETLSNAGCTVSTLPESIWSKLATPVLAALPFVYLAFLYRLMGTLNGQDDSARTYQNDTSHTSFSDVAGLDDCLEEVSEVVSYLSNPCAYHGLGARPPRAVLLQGPPGTGKTLLARAVAGEAHCDAFVACTGSDFVDTYVGRGASRVRTLFDKARRQARGRQSWWSSLMPYGKPPSKVPSAVIFIDEIDALARSRGVFANNDERDNTLNQLLTEMDGFEEHKDVTLIVIAATNRADVLDPAILRRFDRRVYVGYPNESGRKAILLVHARRIQCDSDRIDWNYLARSTVDFSGADLRNVINDAALLAVREKSSLVRECHLRQAIERVRNMKSSGGLAPHLVLS